MPCHYARINLSMGPRGFQMFVEIASRMDGRGVVYETRHDVSSQPREEVRYLRTALRRISVCLCLSACSMC